MSKDRINCSSNDCSFIFLCLSTGEFSKARSNLLGIFSMTEFFSIQYSSSLLSMLSIFFMSYKYFFNLVFGDTSTTLIGAELALLSALLTGVLIKFEVIILKCVNERVLIKSLNKAANWLFDFIIFLFEVGLLSRFFFLIDFENMKSTNFNCGFEKLLGRITRLETKLNFSKTEFAC